MNPALVARRLVAALACVIAGAANAEASRTIVRPSPFEEAGASREGVQLMLGVSPLRCITSAPGRQLCSWRVRPGEQGYELLAVGRGGGRALHIVCDFAESRSAGRSHCTSHRAIPLAARDGEGAIEADALAQESLDAARTLEAISRLLGAGPEDCIQRDANDWVCYWRTTSADPGHATLGPLGADDLPVRLTCLLPLEGGERGDDSCRITLEERR